VLFSAPDQFRRAFNENVVVGLKPPQLQRTRLAGSSLAVISTAFAARRTGRGRADQPLPTFLRSSVPLASFSLAVKELVLPLCTNVTQQLFWWMRQRSAACSRFEDAQVQFCAAIVAIETQKAEPKPSIKIRYTTTHFYGCPQSHGYRHFGIGHWQNSGSC
jgi:hypothetical protein